MKESDWAALWLLTPVVVVSPVYAADYLTTEQAQHLLFPQAETFNKTPVTLSDNQKAKIKSMSGSRQRWDKQEVWRAETEGKLLGWFIVDNVIGKHEFITYAAGLSPDGHVVGIEILSYRETHGGEIREEDWRDNFRGKTLSDHLKLGDDIPNISGATLSCRNVLDGVKRLLVIHEMMLANA